MILLISNYNKQMKIQETISKTAKRYNIPEIVLENIYIEGRLSEIEKATNYIKNIS